MPPKKKEEGINNVVKFGRSKGTLKMGLVGLPNVGKSSLFNLLTDQSVAAENYPFCTIDPTEAQCSVPDPRYDYLISIWNPPSTYPAYLKVTDIAGLIKGASEGQGLGNAFLSHIQAVDGIFHVVRLFDNPDIIHVQDTVDPIRDIETINSELCKKDLDFVKAALDKETLIVKKNPKFKLSPLFIDTFTKMKEMLESQIPIRLGEIELINEKCRLITTEPMIYLLNMDMNDYCTRKNKYMKRVMTYVKEHGDGTCIPMSVEFEQALWALRGDKGGQDAFLAEKKTESALPKIITTGFKELNLIYYFTAGEKEVRAWTVPQGATAPDAGAVIHSDFKDGFIKAEVVAFEDFKSLCGGAKSMGPIKAAGKYRQEGKGYVVNDGDIIHFMFNKTTSGKK